MLKTIKRLTITPRPETAHGEYRHIRLFRMIYILVMGMFLFGFLQTIIFIYNRVYNSLERVETIILLRAELGAEAIDFEQLERVATAWKKKYNEAPVIISHDPFVSSGPPATTTSATTTLGL